MLSKKTLKPLPVGGFNFDVPIPRYGNNSKPHLKPAYLKINFYEHEKILIDKIQKKVIAIFNANDVSFNEQEFYRIFTLNMDNRELLQIMFKLYKEQVSYLYGGLQNAS
ncbi:hypothetical protein [Sulfuricurvum sp.]|uniref:hypothetical protein n=1 Tax=Sulfuricurvum sp. TaxID=2025608 RepID=UPI002608B229|nr:hypothetical protein [Sulfuricurvum sp.]MDD4949630.1 hypothetical protein [Sulfuricurvum sp.]